MRVLWCTAFGLLQKVSPPPLLAIIVGFGAASNVASQSVSGDLSRAGFGFEGLGLACSVDVASVRLGQCQEELLFAASAISVS